MKLYEKNDKLGFYTVGTNKYHLKPEALIEASRTVLFLSLIHI